jgi:energy-coupling factor transporter transmembrane protein EcfT
MADLFLLTGIFAFVTALLGVATITWRRFYFTCPFGILALIVGIFMIVAGAIATKYGQATKMINDELCVRLKDETDGFRTLYSLNIDAHMCTSYCPCWTGLSEQQPSTQID